MTDQLIASIKSSSNVTWDDEKEQFVSIPEPPKLPHSVGALSTRDRNLDITKEVVRN
jgi:hypothetical protein